MKLIERKKINTLIFSNIPFNTLEQYLKASKTYLIDSFEEDSITYIYWNRAFVFLDSKI